MKVYYSLKHLKHIPKFEIDNGKKFPHPEVPERAIRILEELKEHSYFVEEVLNEISLDFLSQIHSQDYLKILKDSSESLKKSESFYPSVFPSKPDQKYKNPLMQRGQYFFDTFTPILYGTYEAAIFSASLAFEAAQYIQQGKGKTTYALCRPPGHHAQKERTGGYCYINNTAVAAQLLSQTGKVAILDIDFHHGNGTQDIFYDRGDVLFISIHADPNVKFPYFSGFTDEQGEGKGLGCNINYPLPLGTNDLNYQKTLKNAMENIKKFEPKYLVVSLGVDTHESDPIGGFKLTTEYYRQMARTISELNIPIVVVQEGGYNTSMITKNVTTFLNGIEKNNV